MAADISIHALREEGDQSDELSVAIKSDFYPRPPRGGRLARRVQRDDGQVISIHALREEGDVAIRSGSGILRISIHALREEGDGEGIGCRVAHVDFYPRPPRGGRQRILGKMVR